MSNPLHEARLIAYSHGWIGRGTLHEWLDVRMTSDRRQIEALRAEVAHLKQRLAETVPTRPYPSAPELSTSERGHVSREGG